MVRGTSAEKQHVRGSADAASVVSPILGLDIVGFPQRVWFDLRMTSATDPQNSGSAPGEAVYLIAPEVATILRIDPWAVVRLCRTGAIRATKPGQKWLIDPADLQAYIDSGLNAPAEDAVSA